MKKRLLSFALTICMVLTLMPMTAYAIMDWDAQIDDTGYDTLQEAVDVVEEGKTIKLMRGITLPATVTIPDTNNKSFTIDLKGCTLDSGSNTAIQHNGSGTLTIRDSGVGGKVTGTKRVPGSDVSGMIFLNGGSLVVESGTVENTGVIGNENSIYVSSGSVIVEGGVVKTNSQGSYSIYNAGSDNVAVTGGTVKNDAINSYAIRSGGTGNVIISGGTVYSNGFSAINIINSGDVIVSGGMVEGKRTAIFNITSTGKITISGTPTIRSDSSEYTIRVKNNLEITGGTVENINVSGTAINADSEATISIPSGSGIIRGGSKVMTKAPNLSSYSNVRVTASTDYSGTPAEVEYSAEDITRYKYFKFEPEPTYTINGTIMGSDTSGGISGATVQLKDGTGTIATTSTNSSGAYTFSGIPAGTYNVVGSASGYNGDTISSVIVSNSNISDQDLTLTVYIVPPSRSSGGGGAPTIVTKIESGETVAGDNVDKLVKEGKNLTVEGKAGEKLVFDTEALKTIDGQTKDNVKVEIKDVSADYKNEHPDRLIVSLTITAGGKHITSFGNGTATVALPYELKAGEKAEDVTVWYLAEDGKMTEVPCTYDPATKFATFKVNHFSLYVVGTADTSKWINPFNDVKESSWFYDAVRYVSANEMMQGTADTVFNPRAKTTRGMIVTILWRMENEPKAAKGITFTDVKNGKYYHDAVAWASEKGIASGYSAEQFGPENNITREQLAVILYNYAASKGYKTGTAADLSAFSDAGAIHSWSKDAMGWANAEGLFNGTGSNLLDPAGAAERCQVAAILQRFVENTVK